MWYDLTITRDDIDSLEGATFRQYSASTALGIASHDALTLDLSKGELEDDIIGKMGELNYTEEGLLDAVYVADTRHILTRLLAYKFLANWFFQDSSKEDSLSYVKYREYLGKYYRTLSSMINDISHKLSEPRNAPRYKLVR